MWKIFKHEKRKTKDHEHSKIPNSEEKEIGKRTT